MRTTIICGLAAVMVVAGCALTPIEMREKGTRTEHTMTQPPLSAASCVARNIEEIRKTYPLFVTITNVRAGRRPDETELIAQTPDLIQMLAEFRPDGTGAKATAWQHPHMFEHFDRAFMGAFQGC